jgi:hypothetical protein
MILLVLLVTSSEIRDDPAWGDRERELVAPYPIEAAR